MRLNGGRHDRASEREREKKHVCKGKEVRRGYKVPVIQSREKGSKREREETCILIYRRGVSVIISPSLSTARGLNRVPDSIRTLPATVIVPCKNPTLLSVPPGHLWMTACFYLCPPRLIQPPRRTSSTRLSHPFFVVCLPIGDRSRGFSPRSADCCDFRDDGGRTGVWKLILEFHSNGRGNRGRRSRFSRVFPDCRILSYTIGNFASSVGIR